MFYDYVASTIWAVLFTGIPVIMFGIYDMDVLPETALRYPWVYRNGVDDDFLNKKFFWGWIAQVRGGMISPRCFLGMVIPLLSSCTSVHYRLRRSRRSRVLECRTAHGESCMSRLGR